MKLLIDENIPGAHEVFAQFGEVQTLPGRQIDAAAVREADILIVRSVTRVDAALLRASRVRFVASATAGIDHVQVEELAALGIPFAHAPGSNADSVVDYVLAALALRFPAQADIAGRSVGIIGCGQVGGRLLRRLGALGLRCRVFDPFVSGIDEECAFEDVLGCDVLSLHVPLTDAGEHPTHGLIGATQLRAMPGDALLINTARGPVLDNRALLQCLQQRPAMQAVLDVWEHEPRVDAALLARVLLGTPHIAGYASDAKLRGTAQVYRALCDFLGAGVPLDEIATLNLAPVGELADQAWQQAVLHCYDPRGDDARLRAMVVTQGETSGGFDRLRRDYPPRRELSAWRVIGSGPHRAQLLAAGFSA